MDFLQKIETILAGWFKKAPRLPETGRKWLTDNIWWMALVGALISILGIFIIIPVLFATLTLTTALGTFSPYTTSYETAYGMAWLSLMFSVLNYVVTAVLLAVAVSPLKAKSRKGWNLLFVLYLVNFVLGVLSSLVLISIFAFIGPFIGAAIGGYFLFEIRDYFVGDKKVAHKKKHAKA